MKRLHNWSDRLSSFLLESMNRSVMGCENPLTFAWDPMKGEGTENCATWTAKGVERVLGVNPYQHFGSHLQYGSPMGAQKVLRQEFNASSNEEMLREFFDERPLTHMQPGDIAMVPSLDETSIKEGQTYTMGLVMAPYVYVMAQRGIERIPLTEAIVAFAVDSFNPELEEQ